LNSASDSCERAARAAASGSGVPTCARRPSTQPSTAARSFIRRRIRSPVDVSLMTNACRAMHLTVCTCMRLPKKCRDSCDIAACSRPRCSCRPSSRWGWRRALPARHLADIWRYRPSNATHLSRGRTNLMQAYTQPLCHHHVPYYRYLGLRRCRSLLLYPCCCRLPNLARFLPPLLRRRSPSPSKRQGRKPHRQPRAAWFSCS
jgi:hypothetical protein